MVACVLDASRPQSLTHRWRGDGEAADVGGNETPMRPCVPSDDSCEVDPNEHAYFESDEESDEEETMFEVDGNETPARVCPPADDSSDEDCNSDWGCS
jgi:hypothetical protein